jgi:chromosome segregation protein
MRLKTLEIKGFKSFAEETVINFQEDVIGIVGPNGSGKSNIVDAIRWVLGEQKSSELRLDHMSNVIFNGTKKRKQSGLAQVTLTFSNTKNLLPTEYSNIAITRRIYRSGESEYLLNGVACRLKDITNLFMDTGIGSNSYAIIALGMVDEILSDKDNARRRMFEQAAGVSKYKVRKRETLSKLQSATDDLERVEDLLFELNNNLKTLEHQAKRTKRYFEIKEEYKQLSIKLAALRAESLKEKFKSIKAQLSVEEDQYRGTEAEIRQLEAQLEAGRKENLDKEKALSDRQRALNLLIGSIRDQENEKKVLEQRAAFTEANRHKLREQIDAAKVKVSALEEETLIYRESLTEDKRLEARLERQLEEAENKLKEIRQSHGSMRAELDQIMQSQQLVERELYDLEKQKAVNTNQIESLRHDLAANETEVSNRQQEISSLKEKSAVLGQEETDHRQHLEQLEKEEEKRREKIAQNEAQQEELRGRIQKIHRELDARRNEYKLTKSMVESLEGFPESIRFLSNTKNWSKGAPLLSDLIYVDAAYRVAIENYLEPYLNYYVVENLEEARIPIGLLQSAQKGKANFFLLDAFRDYVPPVVMVPAEAKPAAGLVQCDPAYRNLLEFLLEKVAVLERDDISREWLYDELILLAQSGQFIQQRRSLSGGSVGLFEGKKIGRKKNLEILENSIKRSEEEEHLLSGELFQLRKQAEELKTNQYKQEIQREQAEINRVSRDRASLVARLESFETYLREVGLRREQVEGRINALEETNAGIEKSLEEKMNRATEARKLISNADVSYRQVAEQLSEASTNFNNRNIEFIRQQNKVGATQRELAFREKQLEETRALLHGGQRNMEEAAAELVKIHDELESLQHKLIAAYEERKTGEGQLSEAEQEFYKVRGSAHAIEDQLRQTTRKSQDLQILINKLRDNFNEVKYQLSSLTERLRIEFGLSINDHEALALSPQDKEQGDETELHIKVERLKSRLDNYGDINPLAVEAYDEMKQRHDLITNQRADILKAKEDLLQTIKEIEETATVQFLDAFGKVRLYFIDVFRSLFTMDDAADLIMLDGENPLESRIEIVAKPKGKRPQTISQLSGGEKTLTATALLFALYLLKPAPFCIFDEVDAPLDDANIDKFNNIIKEFSKDSQFIIVTHNKQTMAAVDTIYGVYMAEQGVSAVTQVDFRSLKNDFEPQQVTTS